MFTQPSKAEGGFREVKREIANFAIGDTVCPGAVGPAGGGGGKAPAGNAGGGGRGGQIRALPSTGIGPLETGTSSSLLLALGALGMMGLSLGSRLDRRTFLTAQAAWWF